jgi:secreted protein with Ig-like and vWFA domain
MSQPSLSPHDPKFTAYALGELEPEEHAAVEAALRDNPAARAVVEEIRATAAHLSAALAAEPLVAPEAGPAVGSFARAAIVAGRDQSKLDGGPLPYEGKKLIRFPQFYYIAGLAAAACFAVVVAFREPAYHPAKQTVPLPGKSYTRIEVGAEAADAPAGIAVKPGEFSGAGATAVTAPAVAPLTPELRLADAGLASAEKAVPLLEQIKIEQATLSTAAPTSLAGGSAADTVTSPATPRTSGASPASAASKPVGVSVRVAPTRPAPSTVEPKTNGLVSDSIKAAGLSVNTERKDLAASAPTSPVARGLNAQGVALSGYEVSVDKDAVSRTRGIPARPAPAQTLLGIAPGQAPAAAGTKGAENEVVMLSPFSVSSGPDRGYSAANTLSGSRWRSSPGAALGMPELPRAARIGNTESYSHTPENEFLSAEQNPLSTFSVDVDTASYTNVRRFIESGRLPPVDAVRVEEMVNYFPYDYAAPKDDQPFAASLEVASAPWAPTHRLVRIGLKARDVATKARPAANLVFLLDVSGSMSAPNRLPLVKESMRLLVGKLRADDHVAIVTYAGSSGLALPSTPVAKSGEILDALDALSPGGSTNGAMGIQLAYDIAKANFVTGGLNRVILCTDGDFNVGISSEGELTRLIGEKAKSGVFLTVLGFGMGNLKDATLEKLADKGNGNYGYIDSRREAEKLLVEQVNGTLMTVAKDVKIQVDFNPAKVASYRLIGYENRVLKKEDFNNDQVDAGEIGAGHTVTALYEIVPVGVEENPADLAPPVDASKYAPRDTGRAKVASSKAKAKTDLAGDSGSNELLTVRIRYKKPDGLLSRRLEFPLVDRGAAFASATADFKFAAAVASFGMILRDSPHKGSATIADVLTWIGDDAGDDAGGHRGNFIAVVNAARRLMR